jgi:hypothetical protein
LHLMTTERRHFEDSWAASAKDLKTRYGCTEICCYSSYLPAFHLPFWLE